MNNKKYKILAGIIRISIMLIFFTAVSYAQRSKIEGIVKDETTGEALYGANVVVLGTNLGAATNIEGEFFIINVPVGTYRIQASMVGYNKHIIADVLVSADRVTSLEFRLSSGVFVEDEIIVVAQRNELHKEVSNTQMVVTEDQIINSAGVRDINAFLEKQPGVSITNGFLEIRGGSADQTGTFINGISYNNAAVGNAETTIPLSAIDQVSLLSGGFNAEYGNFRSGLINVTTKSGSKDSYHGTISVSRNIAHQKRFGPKLSDPLGPELAPYLDASNSFTGNNTFRSGWINITSEFNRTRAPEDQASALDYYLLGAWMHMAVPDYKGLDGLSDSLKNEIGYYPVTEEQKRLFADHARKEEGIDYNIDAGFGGPVPFVGKYLGDATFYISHNTKENFYIVPFARRSQDLHTTLATIKSNPSGSLTLTMNGLWKRQMGLSPLKPAFGDSPDAGREGGFMPVNNLKYVSDIASLDDGPINYWFDPPIFPLLEQTTLMGGFTVNHVLNNSTFWEFTSSYLSIKDHSPTGDNRDNTILTNFGPFPVSEMPYGKLQFAPNNRLIFINGSDTIDYTYPNYDAIPGINRRFRSKEGDLNTNVHTQQVKLKFDIVSQIGEHHYFKSGIEYNRIDIDHKLWLKWNRTGPYNTYEYNYHRIPSQTGFYLQDQITYEGIIATVGSRLDYYYGGGGKWPSGDAFSEAFTSGFGGAPRSAGASADSFYAVLSSGKSLIWEKWEEYDKENPGFLQPVKNHLIFSPRLGISFPVTDRSKFYFNYGHFRSNPPYYTMFLYRYRYDKNGLYEMSNPNLEPPKTISYELGLAYNVFENTIVTLSGYYKDVTGETGEVNYYGSDGSIDYDRWVNNNYEDIKGLEINIRKHDNSWINGWINFNYLLKKSGLTGRETISNSTLNEDQVGLYKGEEDSFLPQPALNANISLRSPDDLFSASWLNHLFSGWRMTIFAEWKAGEYFTFNPFEFNQISGYNLSNNMQWADYYMVDLRLSKSLNLFGFFTTFFIDVSNLFNFKVNLLNRGYAFREDDNDEGDFTEWDDTYNYLASLRLPEYASSEYDAIRNEENGLFIPGNDRVGDLKSKDKPYINDPDYSYFIYGQPRDIWFGIKVDF
jgi:hypothetical protein